MLLQQQIQRDRAGLATYSTGAIGAPCDATITFAVAPQM
jgi:hypothetical protein